MLELVLMWGSCIMGKCKKDAGPYICKASVSVLLGLGKREEPYQLWEASVLDSGGISFSKNQVSGNFEGALRAQPTF